jgi:hypothetical protein
MKTNFFRATKYSLGVFLAIAGLTYGLSMPLYTGRPVHASNEVNGQPYALAERTTMSGEDYLPTRSPAMMVGPNITATPTPILVTR